MRRGDTPKTLITGTSGNDSLVGTGLADSISGRGGDDTLLVGSGNDTLAGGAGDDYLNGEAGSNAVTYGDDTAGVSVSLSVNRYGSGYGNATDGSGGLDTLYYFGSILGSAFGDTISATYGETIAGGAGDDRIMTGYYGQASVDAGGGDDIIYENDAFVGSTVTGGDGNGSADLGAGDDTFTEVSPFLQSNGNQLAGGTSVNTYVLDVAQDCCNYAINTAPDTTTDFKTGAGGDVLDFSKLLPALSDRSYGWGLPSGANPFGGYLQPVDNGFAVARSTVRRSARQANCSAP